MWGYNLCMFIIFNYKLRNLKNDNHSSGFSQNDTKINGIKLNYTSTGKILTISHFKEESVHKECLEIKVVLQY